MTAVEPGLVSTIIPVHNRPELLRQAVESVLAQLYRPIEIIIVDDGSTDDTPAAIRALVAGEPDLIQAVRIANAGPGPAREAGRQRARGEFIQYLDSDDRLLPEKFERQIEALRKHPDCGIAYGYTRLIDAGGNVLRSPFKWTGRDIPFLFPGLLVDRWWCTHTPLYRRTLTDAIGAWTDLRYSQDWEYDARAGSMRATLVNCHVEVSEHRTHEGARQTGDGVWLSPSERVRFFALLLQHARAGGVAPRTSEMRHFTRWVFSQARQCAELGDESAAAALLALARRAHGVGSPDMLIYALLARLLGWRRTTQLANKSRKWLKTGPGPFTRKQSWMEDGQ